MQDKYRLRKLILFIFLFFWALFNYFRMTYRFELIVMDLDVLLFCMFLYLNFLFLFIFIRYYQNKQKYKTGHVLYFCFILISNILFLFIVVITFFDFFFDYTASAEVYTFLGLGIKCKRWDYQYLFSVAVTIANEQSVAVFFKPYQISQLMVKSDYNLEVFKNNFQKAIDIFLYNFEREQIIKALEARVDALPGLVEKYGPNSMIVKNEYKLIYNHPLIKELYCREDNPKFNQHHLNTYARLYLKISYELDKLLDMETIINNVKSFLRENEDQIASVLIFCVVWHFRDKLFYLE